MIDGRPEFPRPVPRSSVLLIDTVLKKVVRAGLVSPVMKTDDPWRRFFFRLRGTCHDEGPTSFERQAVVGGPQPEAIRLDSATAHEAGQEPWKRACGRAAVVTPARAASGRPRTPGRARGAVRARGHSG